MKQTIKYSCTQRTNPQRPDDAKKFYANLQKETTISFDEFISHIQQHNGCYSEGLIKGIVTDLVKCVAEAFEEGKNVSLGDLGVFKFNIESEGTATYEEFTADHITAVKLTLTPGKKLQNLREKMTFEKVATRKAQEAARDAESKGRKSADWSDDDETPAP